MSHPYRALSDAHFWSRSVADLGAHEVDPMVEASIRISDSDLVSTMGSCFAQHLSRFLQASGLNYFVAEPGPNMMSSHDRSKHGYGVYSARYGNVYTVRQAVQLFDRAYGVWLPLETAWRRGDDWVDPFRPQVEPLGFSSVEALEFDRQEHLAAARRVFEESDVLVFTLGLTETFRSTDDGAVFPVVPGSAGGTWDPEKYEFVNFGVNEVIADLNEFVERLRSVNPSVRILLTVSPVPLVATFTDQHVLSATTYSKSVLRVAAAEIEAMHDEVCYFPSFEVITSVSAGSRYYDADLRTVTDEGVAHVMRVFARHLLNFVEDAPQGSGLTGLQREFASMSAVVCDEEVLET